MVESGCAGLEDLVEGGRDDFEGLHNKNIDLDSYNNKSIC